MTRPSIPAAFLAALVLATPIHGRAQDLSAGLRFGLGVSDLRNDSAAFDTRSGFAFGLFADYGFAEWISVQPELQFVIKGAETADTDVDINYLELLLPVQLRIPLWETVRPRLFAGLSVALELSCRTTYRPDGVVVQVGCAETLPEGGAAFVETRTFDFGAVVGGGLDISAGPGFVTADARYIAGFTNINSEGGGAAALQNRVLQFLLGYAVRLAP